MYKLSIDKMYACRIPVDKISVNKMSLYIVSVDEMSIDMSVDKMYVSNIS
jgi:hypothetical protein